jgi:hypothetical protein
MYNHPNDNLQITRIKTLIRTYLQRQGKKLTMAMHMTISGNAARISSLASIGGRHLPALELGRTAQSLISVQLLTGQTSELFHFRAIFFIYF